MVETSIILLGELFLLGLIYIVLSFLEYNKVHKDLEVFTKYRLASLIIFLLGITVHTLGSVLGEGAVLGMQLETAGHFIIMIGAVVLIKQSISLLKLAEEYGYG